MKINYFFVFLLLNTFTVFGQKTLQYSDFTYQPNIKSVLLYPANQSDGINPMLKSPIVALNGEIPLVLEFDDLNASYEQYHLKIIHCTYDWQPSVLSEIEYMSDFNDIIINDYAVSQNTKVSYFHYAIEIPKVRISGNYLVMLYKGRSKNDVILTKRFMVYEPKVSAMTDIRPAQDPAQWRTHQQIDFELNYSNYAVRSPRDEFRVLIRQNQRWDKTIENLKPSGVMESRQQLTYRFFNNENLMLGGNEFRFFDISTAYSKGIGVSKIQQGKEDAILISPQVNRSEFSYVSTRDLNGKYVIDNFDSGNGATQADYVWATFSLKSHELEGNKKVYVNGDFNNWSLNEQNQMEYDAEFGGYIATIQLKQGFYDYDFVVKNLDDNKTDESYFEGNFADTGNTYEILIYHKPPTARAELLVGYSIVNTFNSR